LSLFLWKQKKIGFGFRGTNCFQLKILATLEGYAKNMYGKVNKEDAIDLPPQA
jgi:hypothetical protein